MMVTLGKNQTLLDREIAIGEGSLTALRMGLVQIPVALNETNGGEIFWMCASANMAIYVIEMTKLELNGDLVMLQTGSFQLFSENELIMKYEVEQSSMNPVCIELLLHISCHFVLIMFGLIDFHLERSLE